MKSWLFFPLALLVCVGLILAALGPAAVRPGAAVEALEASGGTLVLSGPALNQLAPTPGFPVTAAPGVAGDQAGPRTVAEGPLEAGAPGQGARLLLGPQTRARLKDMALTVEIEATPLLFAPTTEIAVAMVRASAPVQWVRAAIPAEGGPVRLVIPAADGVPLAIAVWPSVEGAGKGLEIRSIRIGGA